MGNSSKRSFSTRDMVMVGVMAAVIFAATRFLSIRVPMPVGDPTMLKTANALCLLAGMLFGPLKGGLAAGFGSMIFDLTDPVYIRSAPFTFAFFFLMAFVCGLIAHGGNAHGSSKWRNLAGAVVGALTYSCLYLTKSYVGLVLAGSASGAAFTAILPKMLTSSVNALFAIVVSMLLFPALRRIVK